jgi:acyl dehydratase
MSHHQLGTGFYWDDLAVGDTFSTTRRSVTETDLVNFYNLTWFTEELFTNVHDRDRMAISGRVVPGALVFSFAEGLIVPSIQHTGLAFLATTMRILGPTFVGDTLSVQVEVIELKPTSKLDRALIRTRNRVINQHGVITLEYEPLRMLARKPTRPDS